MLSNLTLTASMKLVLGSKCNSITINGFVDADWAGDRDQRKSRSGYIIYLNSSPIIWSSKLQSTIALSSTEAEYVSLSMCARDILWLRNVLFEVGFPQEEPSVVYEDNQACIMIAENSKGNTGIKHVDLKIHFIKDVIKSKHIQLRYIPTKRMVADFFTKQLPAPRFIDLRSFVMGHSDPIPKEGVCE